MQEENQQQEIFKSLNEELKQATFIVMVPDEVDLHGDITAEDEVRKACYNFNAYCRSPNLFHMTGTDLFQFAESYVLPADCEVNGIELKKGTWLTTIQALDDKLWELIKSGEINGVSIGALAYTEDLEKD